MALGAHMNFCLSKYILATYLETCILKNIFYQQQLQSFFPPKIAKSLKR